MRATLMNLTPRDWLLGQGLPAAEADKILTTFGPGAPVQVLRFHRGEVFYRFHGRHARRPVFEVNFWVHGSALAAALGRAAQFEGWLSDEEVSRVAKQYYRDIAAISHLWGVNAQGQPILGEMHEGEFWKIQLQGDEYVDGLLGAIAPQPTHHAAGGQGPSSSILAGGGLQAVLRPGSPFLCTPTHWR
jgi:hypothetical protein